MTRALSESFAEFFSNFTRKHLYRIHLQMGQVFKSGPSKTCGRQHLKKFTQSTLEYLVSNKVAVCNFIGNETKLRRQCFPFNFRSSYRKCSIKKGVLRNFSKFTGKHLHQSLFFNKVAGLRPATLLKKMLWHRCFPLNFQKFLRTPFLQNTSGRLLLEFVNFSSKFFAEYMWTSQEMFSILQAIKRSLIPEKSRFKCVPR